jgi:hypothetical protein
MIVEECPLLSDCEFFNDVLENMPSSSGFMKESYCKGRYATCARYRVFMKAGKRKPPKDLFPHETDKAVKIIALYRRHD